MKKKILIIFITLFLSLNFVNAASTRVNSINAVTVGNRVTFRVTLNDSTPLGSWEYSVSYDKDKLKYYGGDPLHNVNVVQNANTKSKSFSFTFTTKKTGKAYFKFNVLELRAFDESSRKVNPSSKTINILEPKTYSANNYLDSLSIEGYNINFNKNKLDYNLTLPKTTESIKINARAGDKYQRISGIGRKTLEEGENIFKINVIAENGRSRTYRIKVYNPEIKDVKILIDNKEYLVYRKDKDIPDIKGYKKAKTKIKDTDVSILKNDKYEIVFLKDKDNNKIKALLKDKKFYLIKDNIALLEKLNESDNYIYYKGLNLDNDLENNYRYEKTEDSIQIEKKVEIKVKEDNKKDMYVVIGLSSLLLLTYLVILINILKERHRNGIRKKQKKSESRRENNRDENSKKGQKKKNKNKTKTTSNK